MNGESKLTQLIRLEKQIENLKEQLSEKDRYINQFRSLALQQI